MRARKIDPGMKPGPREHRRHARTQLLTVLDVVLPVDARSDAKARDILGVPLVDAGKAAKLALKPVEKAVMVGVARDEAIAADEIAGLDPFDDVDGER